jgi:hypothetical protein
MIVHPDFLDHWKTKKLVEHLSDPAAPLVVLRLWAYCQVQKKSVFQNMDAFRLKSVCHCPISGEKLMAALIECGFVRIEENAFIVHDWEQVNRMLISAWANGKRGGDPAKFRQPTGSRSAPRSPTQSGSPPSRARVREEDKIRAGYPVGSTQKESDTEPAEDLALPERGEEARLYEIKDGEKPDPANVKKFGGLMGDLAKKLKGPAE